MNVAPVKSGDFYHFLLKEFFISVFSSLCLIHSQKSRCHRACTWNKNLKEISLVCVRIQPVLWIWIHWIHPGSGSCCGSWSTTLDSTSKLLHGVEVSVLATQLIILCRAVSVIYIVLLFPLFGSLRVLYGNSTQVLFCFTTSPKCWDGCNCTK